MKTYLIFGLVLALLVACAPQTPGEGSLTNTKWSLISFGEPGAETLIMEGSMVTLQFDGEGQAGGSGGCNSYRAQYEVQDITLSIGQITSTHRACEQETIGQQEQNYFQALESVSKYELNEESLTIWYDDGNAVLNFVKV